MVCLRYFGAGIWHYFALPFLIPNLFRRLFGEGALTAALIPVYTEKLYEDKHAAELLARSVVTILIAILSVITLLGLGFISLCLHFMDLEAKSIQMLYLAAIMLPYMILICTVATLSGVLNVHRHFAAPAAAPIVLNLCIIIAVVFFREFFGESKMSQLYAVAMAVLAAGVLQLGLQIPALIRVRVRLRPRLVFRDEGVRRIIHLMTPMMVGISVVQFNVLLDSLMAYFLSATAESGPSFVLLGQQIAYPVEEGSLSDLYLSQRLYQLPLGVFGVALATAIFPSLTHQAVKKEFKAFSDTFTQGIRMAIFIAIPATVGLIWISRPLIQTVMEWGDSSFTSADTQRTVWTLLFYALGLMAYCLQQLVVRGYYAFQDTTTPVKVALYMVGMNLALNLVLIWPLGTGGLALATALCAMIQVAILLRLLIKRYGLDITKGVASTLVKTVLASMVMIGGCRVSLSLLDGSSSLVELVVILGTSLPLYGLTSLVLGNREVYALFRDR